VKVEDKMFSKYSSQQVESYVERILENHKDETEGAEDEEAEQ
jgi:proteasome alpha subunit